MEHVNFEDKTFENIDFAHRKLGVVEYEKCAFVHCDFSGADLSNARFSACEFTSCNLSNPKTAKTGLHNVTFKGCKLLGVHFEQCNAFLLSMQFENCRVDFCSFTRLNLRKTRFKECTFHEADFAEADLTGSLFDHCDLARTTFSNTLLEKVDFRTSYNFSIDPERNRLKKARFSLAGVPGLLQKYEIDID
jgi:hypothetical protein